MKNILKYIGYCLCFMLPVIIIISVTETFFFKNEYPFVYKTALILSGSMEPTLSVDDLVIVKRADEIKTGDIIAFYDESANKVMHRVIDVEGDTITTQGDANNAADTPISRDKVCGKYVEKVKYLGKIVKFIKTPVGVTICFVLTVIILLIPEKYQSKHAKEEKLLNKTKIIIATIAYAILLTICIVAGYYSKYKTTFGGESTGVVALVAVDNSQTLQVDTSDLYPGQTIKYKFGVKNSKKIASEVTMAYSIEVESTEALPLTYSLKCLSTTGGSGISKNQETEIKANTPITGGVLPYGEYTHIYELTINWDENNNEIKYADQFEIIKIKIDSYQVD